MAATQRKVSLALSVTPLADALPRARSRAWPLLLEATLVAAALGLLLPAFDPLVQQDTGRDGRFTAPTPPLYQFFEQL